ncbi:hypothetical protein LV779_21835 [Streptomyces thinghirensis]|nr:hypothetical protein [Streptomyces thinghirensis]
MPAHDKDPVTAATALLRRPRRTSLTAEDITLHLDATDPLMRWARPPPSSASPSSTDPLSAPACSAVLSPNSPPLLQPFDGVTDYREGDLFGPHPNAPYALPPGSTRPPCAEALDACLSRIRWDLYGSRTRKAIEELFPLHSRTPHPATPT